MLLGNFFNGPSQPIDGNSRRWHIAKNVDLHPILDNRLTKVIVLVPQKSEEVAVVFMHQKTMKHLLDVCKDCNPLLLEAWEKTKEGVIKIRTCEEHVIQGYTTVLGTVIKNYPDLIELLWVVYPKQRKISTLRLRLVAALPLRDR